MRGVFFSNDGEIFLLAFSDQRMLTDISILRRQWRQFLFADRRLAFAGLQVLAITICWVNCLFWVTRRGLCEAGLRDKSKFEFFYIFSKFILLFRC
ncbi:hypothetical protein SUGI_0304860 [Cryptomeria japonica]|nr:hypothetical protein SUGI_0304860 [Cryptomeria japonica]